MTTTEGFCPVSYGYEAVRDQVYPVSGDLLATDPNYRATLVQVRVDNHYPHFVSALPEDCPGTCKWVNSYGHSDAKGCANDAYWLVRVPNLADPALETTELRCGLHRDCYLDPFDPEEGCLAH